MGGALARRVRCVSRVDTHAYCWKTQADGKDGAGNALHYVWLYAHLYFCVRRTTRLPMDSAARTKHAGNGAVALRDDGRVCAVGGWNGRCAYTFFLFFLLRRAWADGVRRVYLYLSATKTLKLLGRQCPVP